MTYLSNDVNQNDAK
jgi:hypothetical protein